MSRIWRKLVFCTLVLTLVTFGVGCTSGSDSEKEWQIPTFGVFRVPQEFMAAEFPNVKKILDSQKEKLNNQAEIPIPDVKERLHPDRFDITAYQLTLNDGQAYHLAWLVLVRDRVALDPQAAQYFDTPLTIEQRVAAIMMQDSLSQNLDKMYYNDPKSGLGLKLLEFDPFDFGAISGKQFYAGGARFLFNYQDFLFPLYMRCWIVNASNHGAAVLLVTTDGERSFWTPVLNSILPTLRPVALSKK